ncbi:Oar protein [Acidisarcina polymorpha]|uniref:Oar protein n=1 Tax=Acidisarcina polymorpha TaxID=2211140 RepID=A0A2Z5G0S6_9BACT|nr:TonB-dependent receptor [Acidisarcina polymorpha]AXC12649.1 Oar protein [Acidisarcina polymorpha]
MKKAALFLVAFCCLETAVSGWAQVDTGSFAGTVKDSTGAVLPQATVTATNSDTGIATVTKTDAGGSYVVTPLEIGRYSLSIESAGFQTQVRNNIVLNVQQNVRLDFTLRVGSQGETAIVTGAPPLLETETVSLGDVITGQQVEQLPLNGRRYTDLATLTAGVAKITEGPVNGGSTPTNGNAGGDFSVNGTRGDQNNFVLDGVDNNSNDNGDLSFVSSVDAIAEFKIQTSNYSAEFGRSGGAVINATTKSGTNQIHGSAWEFLRNDVLDARGYFESPDDQKAPYRQNQFGGTIGGPILKNKAFYFLDYEGTRIGSADTDFATVPTAAEAKGDFSDILGPQTGVDPLGRPVYTNEIYNPATTRTVNGQTVRDGFGFDPATGLPIPGQANVINEGINSIGSNYAALYPTPNLPGFANNYRVNAPGYNNGDQMDARVDESLTSKIQLFERYSYGTQQRFQAPVFEGIADGGGYNTGNRPTDINGAVLGYTHLLTSDLVNALRVGYNRLHYVSNSPSYGQHYPPVNLQIPGVPDDPQVNGLTWFSIDGYNGLGEPLYTPTKSTSQDIQIDDTLNWVHGNHQIRVGPQIHWDQFNLLQIGQPRGNMEYSGQFTAADPVNQQGSGNAVADTLLGLPVSSKISTVSYYGNRQHSYGAFFEDIFKAAPSLTMDLGLRYDYATPSYEAHNRQSNFDYTKGIIIPAGTPGYPSKLANTAKDNFAPRFGFTYKPLPDRPLVVRVGFGRFFVFQEIRTGDPLQINYNLPFFYEPTFISDGLTPALTLATGFPALNADEAVNAGVTSQDFNPRTAVYDEWNMNVEYQLPGDILISPAYVGTKGTHLQVLVDRNQIPTPQTIFDQSLRPYPNFGPFASIENRGNSTYHSFQLKVEKRSNNGLYFISAYTFSKSINDQPEICCNAPWPQNSYNLPAEKGVSDFDNRHRWVTSVDYALPVGKGQRFLNNGKMLDEAFGGWHVGGIITFRSGFAFSPEMSYDPTNTGSQGLLRTDRIGDGHLAHRGPSLWFNPNDFPVPTCNCFGNAGKNILEGPGESSLDLSARKFFPITERVSFEFRAEFFNAFNHAVFSQPDPFITDGPGQTGVITSTVLPQRQIQFAGKLQF